MPVVGSVAFHLALLLVGLLTFRSVRQVLVHQEQASPANLTLASSRSLVDVNGGWHGPLGDEQVRPMQDRVPDRTAEGWNQDAGHDMRSLRRSLSTDAAREPSDDAAFIGVGPGAASGPLGRGGDGDGGPLAAFGAVRSGGGRPSIFETGLDRGRRAQSVAYLCDASGSMLNKFSALRRELARAVQNLTPAQSFAVTFFQGAQCKTLDARLLMATPENKARALAFLDDVVPRGQTDPIPALELAFRQKPELIYLLTDGDFPDNDAVLRAIGRWDADHHVRVNTIAFVGQGDTDTAFIELLQRVARESGGVYRHVREADLP